MGVEMGIIHLKRQFLIRKSATHVWFHRTDTKFKTNSADFICRLLIASDFQISSQLKMLIFLSNYHTLLLILGLRS